MHDGLRLLSIKGSCDGWGKMILVHTFQVGSGLNDGINWGNKLVGFVWHVPAAVRTNFGLILGRLVSVDVSPSVFFFFFFLIEKRRKCGFVTIFPPPVLSLTELSFDEFSIKKSKIDADVIFFFLQTFSDFGNL